MKRWICLFAVFGLGTIVALTMAEGKRTYYVQLVQGTEADQPPVTGTKAIGPRLSKSLHSSFRWKHYWEINRSEVTMDAGSTLKMVLSGERGVEIDLSLPKRRRVTALSNGMALCSTSQPTSTAMTIISADRNTNSAWFLAVRRDKPSTF